MQRLSRLLCAILLLCGCFRAGAEDFELRSTASLWGRTVTQSDAATEASWFWGAFGLAQTWNGQWWVPYASLTNALPDSISGDPQWTFSLDGSQWSATVDATVIANARSTDHVLWLDFKPVAGGVATWTFLVSSEFQNHALGLVQPGVAGGAAVVAPLSCDWVSPKSIPTIGEASPGFYGAVGSATLDPAKPFWVVDFTTGKRTPTGATLIRDGWVDDPDAYPLASVTFYFDQRLAGNRFTLHWQFPGQPEMVQSLVAVPGNSGEQQLGDGSREDETDTVSLTGSVALGSNYWITRASDGWSSGTWNIDPFAARPAPLQWSLRGTGIAPVPWQTVTFYIASGMGGTASVYQNSGTRALMLARSGGSLADYDESGNPHFFVYDEWTAVINASEPCWLIVGSTTCSLGETWFTNGWTALNGTPPLWQTARFTIASGIAWSQYVSQSNGMPALTLAGSGYQTRDYFADGTPNFLNYDLWDAVVDANRSFFLNVNGTALPANETLFTNGWQWQGGGAPDLRTVSFLIPNSINSFNPYATQNQQNLTLSYGGQQGFIEDYVNDGSGTPHFFYYLVYTATVDVSRPFTLTATDPDGTGSPVTLGDHETIFYNGWTPQNGAKVSRISLNGDRAGHGFQFLAPDGTAFPWEPAGVQEMQTLTLWDPWSWNPDTGAIGVNWTFGYPVFTTACGGDFSGQTGYWVLKDMTTGEVSQFNPGGAAVVQLDLRQWWLPAQSFNGLQISLSRWGHDLRVRQRDGGEYPVVQLASQGSTTSTPGGTALDSYYYFDATASRRMISGMDWWIYDATTGEYAAANTTDLITWYYTPKPIQLSFTQSDLTAVDLKWNLPATLESGLLDGGFIIEWFNPATYSWDAVTSGAATSFQIYPDTNSLAFHHTDSGLSPGTYTYRIRYTYGGQTGEAAALAATVNDAATLDGMDSNRDGVSDLDEILAATIPGYSSPVIVTDPAMLSVKAGASRTFTANVTGGVGNTSLSLGATQTLQFGTIAVAPNTTGGITLTYTANAGAEGTDHILFRVTDAYRDKTKAVSITVNKRSDTDLKAKPMTYFLEPWESGVTILLKATGGDGSPITYSIKEEPGRGGLDESDIESGIVAYYGDPLPDLPDAFDFQATDDSGSSTAQIVIMRRPLGVKVTAWSPGKVGGTQGTTGTKLTGSTAILLPNNDNDDGISTAPGQPEHRDNADTEIKSADDDIVMIEIKLYKHGTEGTFVLNAPPGIRVFKADGTLMTDHNLDSSQQTTRIYVEGLDGFTGADLSATYTPIGDSEPGGDSAEAPPGTPVTGHISLLPVEMMVDANRDGTIDDSDRGKVSEQKPWSFWVNDNDDKHPGPLGSQEADWSDQKVDGANDLKDFFPMFLDIQAVVKALPPGQSVKCKLKQADGAVNLVETHLARDRAFSYLNSSEVTGYGFGLSEPASTATTTEVTAAGVQLSDRFLGRIRDYNEGVILVEGRKPTIKPLVLTVEKDGVQVAEVSLPLSIAPRILLLLHGMNSNTHTWDEFENAAFPNDGSLRSMDIRDNEFSPDLPATLPCFSRRPGSFGNRGVRYYRLQFGALEKPSTTRTGLEGLTTVEARGGVDGEMKPYLTTDALKCGDFETFDELAQEVDTAINKLLRRHPGAQIVLVGHSRGGLAGRKFLESSSTNKSAVVGFLTTSSLHKGSQMGRIYQWLADHPRRQYDSNLQEVMEHYTIDSPEGPIDMTRPVNWRDWVVADFLYSPTVSLLGISNNKDTLDVRRPVIMDMDAGSDAIVNLNDPAQVAKLPPQVIYGEIVYAKADLGVLKLKPIRVSVFDSAIFPNLSEAARTYLLGAGKAPNDFVGDGLIWWENQYFTKLSGFPAPGYPPAPPPATDQNTILRKYVTDRDVVHTDAPVQVDDLRAQLRLIVPSWFP